MIPLHDNIPTRRFPVVTILLIAVNVVVYLLDVMSPERHVVRTIVDAYGHRVHFVKVVGHYSANYSLTPAHVTENLSTAWVTLFTSMFLHGSLLHIGGNMLYLWIFGNNVEDVLGRARYLAFYLVCGMAAAYAQIASDPHTTIPMVGASGAIAGLMGAYLVLFPHAEILAVVPIFWIGILQEVPAFLVIGFWASMQFVSAHWMGGGDVQGGGMAYFAHIGGLVAGVLSILLLGGRRLVVARGQPDPDGKAEDDQGPLGHN